MNREYTNLCIQLGFLKYTPPFLLTNIKCSLGDFLDYSIHSKKMISTSDQKSKYLTSNSILILKDIN